MAITTILAARTQRQDAAELLVSHPTAATGNSEVGQRRYTDRRVSSASDSLERARGASPIVSRSSHNIRCRPRRMAIQELEPSDRTTGAEANDDSSRSSPVRQTFMRGRWSPRRLDLLHRDNPRFRT